MSTLPYALVDVFAEAPLEGNMLAIFTDARGLSTERMQALARETNLAETTFILPGDPELERTEGVRVRIFTTEEELPFAGHPTLGTASWLHLHHPTLRGAETVTLALKAGPIQVRFQPNPGPGVFGTMRQHDPVFGATHSLPEVAGILGVPATALNATYPIQTVSTGLAFCVVLFRSVAELARMEIAQTAAQLYLDRTGAKFFYCLAPAETPGVAFHARMQFYNGEDPATGSAAGCAVSWLVLHGLLPSGTPAILEQGIEIRRPSRIHVQATLTDGKISSVFVGGRTIHVANGSFLLPPEPAFPQPIVTEP